MKNSKVRKYFGAGRKIIFSLALFLLVFAAASVVKIQAGTEHSGRGWLGGWTQDGDGNFTGVGWISMNNTNCDTNDDGKSEGGTECPAAGTVVPKYGVNIPSGNDPVTGYAWMNAGGNPDNGLQNGIGWIDFNPQDHCVEAPTIPNISIGQYQAFDCHPTSDPGLNCGGQGGVARVAGINLQGCARIVSIAQATVGGNSGGWQGWIKLKGTTQDKAHDYGVTLNSNGTFCKPGTSSTYLVNGRNECHAWSSELGWIDFSRASFASVPSIDLTPASFSLGGSAQTLRAAIVNATPAEQTITFAKTGANPDEFNLSANTCAIDNGTGWCEISVTAAHRTSAFTATITASSPGFSSDSSNGTIVQALACTVSCPSTVEVITGQTKDYDVSVSGPAGCSEIDSCSMADNAFELSSTKVDGNTCRVTSSGTNRAGSAVSTSSAGAGTCPTTVYVKGPGWVETNPQ
jgi:hypothetical protein